MVNCEECRQCYKKEQVKFEDFLGVKVGVGVNGLKKVKLNFFKLTNTIDSNTIILYCSR